MITPRQERIENFLAWVIVIYLIAMLVVWIRSLYLPLPAHGLHPVQIVAPAPAPAQTNALFIQDEELSTPGQYAADHATLAKEGK
jgi:hypothetical protein